MKTLNRAALWLFALLLLAGCASTKVTARQPYAGEKIPRPDRIIVYDFAATPADVPAESCLAGHTAQHGTQTAEEIEVGRKLGAQVAKELVAEIQDMGLPATLAAGQAAPRVGDIVFKGYFVSIDQGSAAERILVGFGSGAAELHTVVEAYQMTGQGLRRLGSGENRFRRWQIAGRASPRRGLRRDRKSNRPCRQWRGAPGRGEDRLADD